MIQRHTKGYEKVNLSRKQKVSPKEILRFAQNDSVGGIYR